MKLEAGELEFIATLRARPTKTDAYGDVQDQNENWTDVTTFHCSLNGLTARNVAIGKGFAATCAYESKFRFRPTVTTSHQIVIRNRVYSIDGVLNDPQRDWTQAFLTEVI